MNTKSIRFRLTVWYAAIVSLALAVIFAAFYILTEKTLYSHTDIAISTHNRSIAVLMQSQEIATNPSLLANVDSLAEQFDEMPGMLLVIGDPQGNMLYGSQDLGSSGPVITDLLEESASIQRPVFVSRTIGASPVRFGIFPVRKNGVKHALIVMGQPMEVIQTSLRTLAFALSVFYIGILVLIILGGFFLAGKAMNPIAAVSRRMKKITAGNLALRVPVPATGDEIEDLSRTFNALLDHLAEAFERERQFIGDVAHELKTPVAALIGSVELALSRRRSREEYRSMLTDVLADSRKLSATVTDILDLAWVGADTNMFQKGTCDLSGLLGELAEIAVKLGTGKRLGIRMAIKPGVSVRGSREKLFRALLNIIDNAVKYTPTDGTVRITLHAHRREAVVMVRDTGIGIPAGEIGHIFKRFYRGSKTLQSTGSGLGLAIARGIIEAHSGMIHIASKPGKGTTVTVMLPVVPVAGLPGPKRVE